MSQERWDVVVRYVDGPLAQLDDQVYRGPIVRMGANPGPGGVSLQGYRGLDARHAVVTSYDGGSVAIAPVGRAQVRVAPHPDVDWHDVQALHEPVYLSDGCAVHLGPPERGLTFIYVTSQRLGVWEERRILSDAAQAAPDVQPTNIKELSTQRGVPPWFIGGVVVIGLVTSVAVLVSLVSFYKRPIAGLGPVDEGKEYYEYISEEMAVNTELREGLDQPFADFVMIPNAQAAHWPEIGEDPRKWDPKLLDMVTRSVQLHSQGWRFWDRLEQVTDDWAYVVGELRKAGLPEAFGGIPYRESGYRKGALSPVCAKGWWQFMPEVAIRYDLVVRDCRMKGAEVPWTPPPGRFIPVGNVRQRGEYVSYNPDTNKSECRIQDCAVDERVDLEQSTRAAIKALREAWEDPDIMASGAAVQLTITSHNAGYDDARFRENRKPKMSNVLPAYRKYVEDRKLRAGPFFIGDSITCTTTNHENDACGGVLMGESQHYAYNIIAEHFLAVCYYGMNHDDHPAFQPWRRYVRGDGYCTRANIPTADKVRARLGR